jgi:hypothetical protein
MLLFRVNVVVCRSEELLLLSIVTLKSDHGHLVPLQTEAPRVRIVVIYVLVAAKRRGAVANEFAVTVLVPVFNVEDLDLACAV